MDKNDKGLLKKVFLLIGVLYITIGICIIQFIAYRKNKVDTIYQQMNKTISKTSPKQ